MLTPTGDRLVIERNKQFKFERLEDRQMMAGDVTAILQSGNLVISEVSTQAGQANKVWIQGLANGQVRVTTTPGGSSKVNGQAFQDFTVPGNLSVRLGGGDDVLQLGADAAAALAMPPRFNEVTLDVAGPTISVYSDTDEVRVYGVNSRSSLSINTGKGNDLVQVGGINATGSVVVGDGLGIVEAIGDDLLIATGAGADRVNLAGGAYRNRIDIQTYANAGENDADRVRFDRVASVRLGVEVRLGGGDDSLNVLDKFAPAGTRGLQIGGGLEIDAGAGNDTIYLRNFVIGQQGQGNIDDLYIQAGSGADSLIMTNDPGFGLVGDDIYVQMHDVVTENDIDTVQVDNVLAKWARYFLGGGDDTLRITKSRISFLSIDGHDGNDVADVLNCSVYDWLMADLGKGNDTFNVENVAFLYGGASLHGGEGYDRLSFKNSPLPQPMTKSGWEEINWKLQPVA